MNCQELPVRARECEALRGRDARLRADHQIIIVAIKKKTGHMVFNPAPDTILEVGDILVAMGSLVHLGKLDELESEIAKELGATKQKD